MTNQLVRRGYTLVEMMVVIALLAAMAGLSWPALLRPWTKSTVQSAAQEFARQLALGRLQAIESSSTWQLRWQPGSGRYQLAASEAPEPPEVITLSDDVQFADPFAMARGPQPAAPNFTTELTNEPVMRAETAFDSAPGNLRTPADEWLEPCELCWFYPDGRTSNGRWTLESSDGYQIQVDLRGLTGGIRIDTVRPVDRAVGARNLADDSLTESTER